MQSFTVTNSRRTEFTTYEAEYFDLQALKRLVHSTARPLTFTKVASSLGGKRSTAQSTILLEVLPFKVIVHNRGQVEVIDRHAPKPGINQIRDWRTRPAPFLRDGTCRG
jgi:hypothetical protein